MTNTARYRLVRECTAVNGPTLVTTAAAQSGPRAPSEHQDNSIVLSNINGRRAFRLLLRLLFIALFAAEQALQ